MTARRRTAALTVLAALALLLAPAAPAHAHAALAATDPEHQAVLQEPPDEITLRFDEPVQPVPDGMALIDANGRSYAVETTASDQDVIVEPSDLGEGRFLLNWRVVAADGRPVTGVLEFSVGDAPTGAPSSAAAPPVRWPPMIASALHYAGLLLFTGLLCFRIAIARGHWPPHPRHRLLRASGATAAAAAALAVPIGALDAAALPLSRITDMSAWRDLVQPGAVLVAALTALGIGAAYGCFTRTAARWSRPAALTAAALALAAPVLAGHTRSYDPGRLMAAADLVHLLAGAVWLGGLAGLTILLRATRTASAVDAAAQVVARFSAWAGATVAALGASGLVMALILHRSWSSLLESDHGLALLAKLDLVALALALAAWNRYLLVPVIRRTADRRAGLRRLRRVLLAEAAAVALAVVATGVMVNLSPGAPEPVALGDDPGRGAVNAAVDPGGTGENATCDHYMATATAHVA